MRALMWFGLVASVTVSLLIACVPGPASAVDPLTARVVPWPVGDTQPMRLCDDQGICCYTIWRTGSISCVATKIIVIISPGDVKDERTSQISPPTGGEVTDRALEKRFFIGAR